MPRCELTGKSPKVANLRSHSNIKTKTKSYPNVQQKRIFSNGLKRLVGLKLAASTIRDMEHQGGFDTFVLRQPDSRLSRRALLVKRQLLRKLKAKKANQKG